MKNDPIVEEVRRNRAALVKKYGSARKWLEHLMAQETPENTVSFAPKKAPRSLRMKVQAAPRRQTIARRKVAA